ncbi:hypothetical protein [Streptomyces sp. NBC_00096]|uniref:hypothetical protein n=1 Tax=Streptomyces sp. NBC_00096 TaxID=2975650 RepID=UPI0032540B6F
MTIPPRLGPPPLPLPDPRAYGLDRSRRLRDRFVQGAVTNATVHTTGAIDMVRAVFEAVRLPLPRLPRRRWRKRRPPA